MSQYNKVTPELIEALKAAVPGRISVNGDINEDFSHDEMPIYGKAMREEGVEAVSPEEVAAVMKRCNEHHVPGTPRGDGTGVTGGAGQCCGGGGVDEGQ